MSTETVEDTVNTEATEVTEDQETEEALNQEASPVPDFPGPDRPEIDAGMSTSMWQQIEENWNRLLVIQGEFKASDRPKPTEVRQKLADGLLYNGDKAKKADISTAKEYADAVKKAEEELSVLKKNWTDFAFQVNGLDNSNTAEETTLKTEFKFRRKTIVNQLSVLRDFAKDSEQSRLHAFAEEALTHVPGGKSGAVFSTSTSKSEGSSVPSGESKKIREWAKAQGLDVKDRGRIHEDIVKKYNEAHPAG